MKKLATFLGALLLALPAQAANREAAQEALATGARYFYAGNLRAARIEALNAVKADRQWPLAQAFLARMQLGVGEAAAAQSAIEQAVRNGMTPGALSHLSAHVALMQGRPGAALNLSAIASDNPVTQAYALRMRAAALVALGDRDNAAQAFDAALEAFPESSLLWTDIGRFRLGNGDVGGAGQAARHAVELNPNNVEALVLVGQLVRGQYGLNASLEWFDRALDIDPSNLPALGESAATLGDLGQNASMLAVTRRMLSIDPDSPRALYLQAVMAARAGQDELARGLLYRVGGRMGRLPGLLLLRGVLEMRAGNADQAMEYLEPVAWLQPANLTARRLYGIALIRAGEKEEAFHRLAPLGDRADADSYTLLSLARLQEGIGRLRGAGILRDRAAISGRVIAPPLDYYGAFGRDTIQGDSDDADIAVPRIARLVASGNSASALSAARRIAEANPGAAAAQVLLGDVLEAQLDFRGAAEAYRKAANVEFSENVVLRLVSALQRSGQGKAARLVLDTFLEQNPRNVPALLVAADDLLENGQWDVAIKTLDGLRLRLGNRDATLLTGLAWAWYKKGSNARALMFADSAYALAPANPVIAGTVGMIRFESGYDRAGGKALLKKAARIAPDNVRLRNWLRQASG